MARAALAPVYTEVPSMGIDGRTVLAGARAPLVTDGRVGDFWVDTQSKKLYGPKSAAGWPDKGLIRGAAGWYPLERIKSDGARRVVEIYDWAGGEGTKPTTGYKSSTGALTTIIAEAEDVRGAEGPEMLIDALDDGADDVTYDDNAAFAKAGDDNKRQPLKQVLGAGGLLQFETAADAAALVIPASVKAVQINGEAGADGGPGQIRRRVNTEPSSGLKHRSADRFTADGGMDSANGGWWLAVLSDATKASAEAGTSTSGRMNEARTKDSINARVASSKDQAGSYPANWAAAHALTPNHAAFVKYLWAGVASEDADGDYVEDGGGLFLGGFKDGQPRGVRIRQEGFSAHNETGSWAAYPLEPNRWCGLSIAPSGAPEDLPTNHVTSWALQLRNGANEERFTCTALFYQGVGTAAYRFATVTTGTGEHHPVEFAVDNSVIQYWKTDRSVEFNNIEPSGASGGNTYTAWRNPSHANSFGAFVRQNGLIGLGWYNGGVYGGEIQLRDSGPHIVSTQPTLWLEETDAAADNKKWFLDSLNGQLRLFATNDAVNAFGQALTVYRSGSTIAGVDLMAGGSLKLNVNASGVGFNGTAGVAKYTLPGPATDAATTQALANALRTALITNGLAQ